MTVHDTDDVTPADLAEAESWRLFEAASLGRIAFMRDGAPDILPVNLLVHDRAVYLRTARDSKLAAIDVDPRVALEVDGEDDTSRWSVVMKGTAAQVTSEFEIRSAGVPHLVSWAPTPKRFVLRITPAKITGRRFAKSAVTTGAAYAVPVMDSARSSPVRSRADRPMQIPHFGPPRPQDADGA